MSDTLQSVGWHLRNACPFRRGDAVDGFATAFHATSEFRRIDDMAAAGEVDGDVVRHERPFLAQGAVAFGRTRGRSFALDENRGLIVENVETCGYCP